MRTDPRAECWRRRWGAAELMADRATQMAGDTSWRVDLLCAPAANPSSLELVHQVGSLDMD